MLAVVADLTKLAAVDRDADHYTLVGGASIYPMAWSILLAARDAGLAGVITTMVVRFAARGACRARRPHPLCRGRRPRPRPPGPPTDQAATVPGRVLRHRGPIRRRELHTVTPEGRRAPRWPPGPAGRADRGWHMKVRIGVGLGTLPAGGNGSTPTGAGGSSGFARVIDRMAELGFDSIWLPEILTAPTLDPLTGLSFAAARHPRLKLGTTMLLPGRNLVRLGQGTGHTRRAVGRAAPRHPRARHPAVHVSRPPPASARRPGASAWTRCFPSCVGCGRARP